MSKSRDLRIKTRRLRIVAILCILLIAGNMLIRSELSFLLWEMGMMAVKDHTIPISDEWNLIVVNRWNEIPENYSVTLTEMRTEPAHLPFPLLKNLSADALRDRARESRKHRVTGL